MGRGNLRVPPADSFEMLSVTPSDEKILSQKSPFQNVTEIVTKSDVCIGCGLCAGVCPNHALEMHWTNQGEFTPAMIANCQPFCNICLAVCPFSDQVINQDDIAAQEYGALPGINKQNEAGYFLTGYVGFSTKNNQRIKGASGGMATWFLESILESGDVDGVICVIPTPDDVDGRLFKFTILTDPASIYLAAKSKYYPVEISEIIRFILSEKEDRKYAVIGLPCLIYGLNLAGRKLPKLQRKLSCKVSLVCGQLPNRFYTELLALESGIHPNEISMVDYRVKDGTVHPGNFGFRAISNNGKVGRIIPYNSFPYYLCKNWFFTHNACNYCDDAFGETADAVFMDAWLPECGKDPQGTSLIIVRRPEIQELFEKGINKALCHLEMIPIEQILQSQNGVIFRKKRLIKGKIYRAKRFKQWTPVKRLDSDKAIYYKNWFNINMQTMIMRHSKQVWQKYRNDRDSHRFWRGMFSFIKCLAIHGKMERLVKILYNVKRFFSKIQNTKRGA
jgi:coenzyme F420 hydrogenase subunit beta